MLRDVQPYFSRYVTANKNHGVGDDNVPQFFHVLRRACVGSASALSGAEALVGQVGDLVKLKMDSRIFVVDASRFVLAFRTPRGVGGPQTENAPVNYYILNIWFFGS